MNRNNRLHLIYGIVVLFLCAILWYTQHQQSQALSLMARQYEVSERAIASLQTAANQVQSYFDQQVKAYNSPINLRFKKNKDIFQTIYSDVSHCINSMKGVKSPPNTGGYPDFTYSQILNFHASQVEILHLRNLLKRYKEHTDSVFSFDVFEIRVAHDNTRFHQLLCDDSFWEDMETMPSSMCAQSVNLILEQLTADHLWILNSIFDLVRSHHYFLTSYDFKAAISPEAGVIRVGEAFKATIYPSTYMSICCEPDVELTGVVNGQPYEMKDGFIEFKEKATKPGKKMVKAEIRLRNKYNGAVETYNSEYQYLVLPR